eukprot:jgi/Bigna1/90071/estExt_fgenesh1_pg.C_610101
MRGLGLAIFAFFGLVEGAPRVRQIPRSSSVSNAHRAVRYGMRTALLNGMRSRATIGQGNGHSSVQSPPKTPERVTPFTKSLTSLATAAAVASAGPLLTAHEALAAVESVQSRDIPKAAYPSLGLFLLAFPGVWSQIKRAPKANIKRATFEVAGPKAPNGVETDVVARQLFQYMLKYNYAVKDRGEIITFSGKYASNRGQAAFITAFTFLSFLSLGLVLSTVLPDKGGNAWYLLSLTSPAAGYFVLKNGEREEEFRIKMETNEDGTVTDVYVEGDIEEIERMQTELGLTQKGKVKVKGLFEDEEGSATLPTPPGE